MVAVDQFRCISVYIGFRTALNVSLFIIYIQALFEYDNGMVSFVFFCLSLSAPSQLNSPALLFRTSQK